MVAVAVAVGVGVAVVVVVVVAVAVVVGVVVGVGDVVAVAVVVGVGDVVAVAVVVGVGVAVEIIFNKRRKQMDIDNLTIKEIKHINSLLKGGETSQSPYKIGEAYFFRTVTHHLTGRVKRVTAKEIVITEAAWIADDGRFYNALNDGKLNEVEPFPQDEDVIVGRGAMIDAVRWKHPLPKDQI